MGTRGRVGTEKPVTKRAWPLPGPFTSQQGVVRPAPEGKQGVPGFPGVLSYREGEHWECSLLSWICDGIAGWNAKTAGKKWFSICTHKNLPRRAHLWAATPEIGTPYPMGWNHLPSIGCDARACQDFCTCKLKHGGYPWSPVCRVYHQRDTRGCEKVHILCQVVIANLARHPFVIRSLDKSDYRSV